jgi:uncharacterized membrane protein YeaQ/YmgE (transglycosylase-associated protein family)
VTFKGTASRISQVGEDKMMYHLLAFALIGLLAGIAARNFFPGQHAFQSLGTWLLGTLGAVGGGLLSWSYWPALAGYLHLGNLLMAFLGAVLAIAASAGLAYARRSA